MSVFGYTNNTRQEDQFILGCGLFMGFVDNKKNVEYHQTSPLRLVSCDSCLFVFFYRH